MYARPSAPLDIGGVIDDAIRLYRASFSRCWLLALGLALTIAATQIVLVLAVVRIAATMPRGAPPNPLRALGVLFSPAAVCGYVLISLVWMVFYGALFALEAAVARGDGSFTVGGALAKGLRRLPGMLLATIVVIIAFGVGGAVLFLIPIPRLFSVPLFLILSVYLWGKLQLWQASMFSDDAGALDSLGNSWRLTQGRWWRTVTIFTVAVIVAYVFTLAVGLLGSGATAVFAATHRDVLQTQLFAIPFRAIGEVIITPVLPAAMLAIYHDCKLRSEGGDLAARVGTLGA
jgi:hypothetical protein